MALGGTLGTPDAREQRTVAPVGVPRARPLHLSPRQRQIAARLCDGEGYKEIATALGLSAGTVKLYAAMAIRSTGARNCTQLAVWWAQGRFDPPVVDVFPTVAREANAPSPQS